MSTQRRESHSTSPTEYCWDGALRGWRSLSDTACAENREQLEVARTALQGTSPAAALTAPHREATNSLQLDSCNSRFVQVVRPEIRRGSPPVWEARRTLSGPTASRRSSLPLIPHPPVLESLHPAFAPSSRPLYSAGRKAVRMAKEICISSTPHETRLAILEDDQLAEIYYERENEYTLAGSIYNGRVTRDSSRHAVGIC